MEDVSRECFVVVGSFCDYGDLNRVFSVFSQYGLSIFYCRR